jgi:hypothetical protein
LTKLRRAVISAIEGPEAQDIVNDNILKVGNYFYLLCCYTNLSFSSLIGQAGSHEKANEYRDH